MLSFIRNPVFTEARHRKFVEAMSLADEPIGRAPRTLPQRVGRTSLEEMIFADGCLVLCVIIGTPHGRWRAEVTANTAAGLEATRLLCEAFCCNDLSSLELDRQVTLVIAVVQSWRFVHDQATHEHSRVMMEAVRSAYSRRAGVTFFGT